MNPDSDLIGLHFILAGAGILLTLLGLFLVIANRYSITEWVLTIRRNPRYNRGDASIPLLGGLILCVGNQKAQFLAKLSFFRVAGVGL